MNDRFHRGTRVEAISMIYLTVRASPCNSSYGCQLVQCQVQATECSLPTVRNRIIIFYCVPLSRGAPLIKSEWIIHLRKCLLCCLTTTPRSFAAGVLSLNFNQITSTFAQLHISSAARAVNEFCEMPEGGSTLNFWTRCWAVQSLNFSDPRITLFSTKTLNCQRDCTGPCNSIPTGYQN